MTQIHPSQFAIQCKNCKEKTLFACPNCRSPILKDEIDHQPKCKYRYDKKYFSMIDEGQIQQYPCKRCNQPDEEKKLHQCQTCLKMVNMDHEKAVHDVDEELLENWENQIKGWKTSLRKIIWSNPEKPGKAIRFVESLLRAVEEKTRREERERALEAIRKHEEDCEMSHTGVCMDEMKSQILNDQNQ